MSARLLLTAAGALVVLIAAAWLLRDPFGLRRARAERLEREASAAQQDADARRLEVAAERQSVRRVDGVFQRARKVDRTVTEFVLEAAQTTEASTALSTQIAERLRRHDRTLCEIDQLPGCPQLNLETD